MANRAVEKVSGGSPFPPVIEDGNSVGWYIADDLTTITKDASDFVSVWADKLGSGHDLLQAVGTNQPKWFLNDGVLLDGIDNFMKTLAFIYNQPEQIYIVFKQVTFISAKRVFDGDGINSGMLQQIFTSPDLRLYAGAFSSVDSNLSVDTYGIARVLFNGASSKFIINENTPIIGNFGTNNMSGFTLAKSGSGGNFSNIQVKEILLRNVADSAQDEQDIYDYLAAKYSI